MIDRLEVRSTGGDGAFVGLIPTLKFSRDAQGVLTASADAGMCIKTNDGAEQRPLGVIAYPPPPVHRSAWPSTLAFGAIVLALDHGNVGASLLIALWWASWAVAR